MVQAVAVAEIQLLELVVQQHQDKVIMAAQELDPHMDMKLVAAEEQAVQVLVEVQLEMVAVEAIHIHLGYLQLV